jgi:four helix bundle protein
MSSNKPYDLEERTSKFARDIITFVNSCPKTIVNIELLKQLIRSSGSVGANYIEAREALSKKDFALRIKLCRKEVKESAYWLRLLEIKSNGLEQKRRSLITESTELLKIFSSIVEKVSATNNEKRG